MGLEEVLSASITPKIPIILASGSKSRKQMLEEAGICFEIIKTDTDEDALKKEMHGLPFEQQVIKLATAIAVASLITCCSNGSPCISFFKASSSVSVLIISKQIPASSSICFLLLEPDASIIGIFGVILADSTSSKPI